MKKYKIVKNKTTYEIPSEKVINKYKNFNIIQTQYQEVVKRQKLHLYKNKKLFLFLFIIALIAYLVFTA
jgi:hypothetical protein